jgi:hypothetical protein
MNAKEINEGNKLIAEFLEFRKGVKTTYRNGIGQSDWYYFPSRLEYLSDINIAQEDMWNNITIIDCGSPHMMKFHYSWDWLMIVVEKIESLKFNVHLDPKHRCVIFNGNKNLLIDCGSITKPKIEAVWKAVVEFIKWYNQQKEK